MDSTRWSINLRAADLAALPRVADLDMVIALSRELLSNARQLDDQSRRLRGVVQELSDFLR
jgi:hypothetical protein